MNGGHLLELVLEKKVQASTHKIVHESSGCEGVAETTCLLAEGVEEVVNDEFFGHFERFRESVLKALSDTEEEPHAERGADGEGGLFAKVVA